MLGADVVVAVFSGDTARSPEYGVHCRCELSNLRHVAYLITVSIPASGSTIGAHR